MVCLKGLRVVDTRAWGTHRNDKRSCDKSHVLGMFSGRNLRMAQSEQS